MSSTPRPTPPSAVEAASAPRSAGAIDVEVGNSASSLPFSKGLLSQSLLATAIDTADAIGAAREIERRLGASGVSCITRRGLRELASSVLRESAGDEVAERYLLWRQYQEPERPVVLLLAGTSGVGKTSLSLEVARRLGIGRVQSTDSIRQIMRIMIPPQLIPALHASSYDAYLKLPYELGRTPSVVDGFRAQAAAVSIGVHASIERTISESANLIIDGVSIVPDLLDLARYEESAEVITLLIATRDEDALRSRFVIRADGQSKRAAHRYLEHIEGILAIQRHLVHLAERSSIPVVDNASIDQSVQTIIGHIMTRLRSQRAGMA